MQLHQLLGETTNVTSHCRQLYLHKIVVDAKRILTPDVRDKSYMLGAPRLHPTSHTYTWRVAPPHKVAALAVKKPAATVADGPCAINSSVQTNR